MIKKACNNLENTDIEEIAITQKEYKHIIDLQATILEMVALDEELQPILDKLCLLAEKLLPNSVASIMMIDKKTNLLEVASAPSISKEVWKRLSGLKPGPGAGSCGNAIFDNKPVFVRDTFHDPKWHDLRDMAHNFNLCSCWSMPIRDENSKPIGSFALSSFEHRMPSLFHKKLLQIVAHIVNIACKHDTQIKTIARNQKRLRLFSTALENTSEGLFITNEVNQIIEINSAFTKILGYTREDVLGKNPNILSSSKHNRAFYKNMWDSLHVRKYWHGEIINRHKDGPLITQWLTISVIEDHKGKVQNYLAEFADISELKLSQKKVEFLAYHDELTGLYNKVYLEKILLEDNKYNSLVLLNIDNFSYVNLAYGFEVGDKLLMGIANELKTLSQGNQNIFRVNSDEFAIICDDKDAPVMEKVEMLRNHFSKLTFTIDEITLNASFSYGISINDDVSLQNSALALKEAKESGKNRYYFFDKTANSVEISKRENFIKYNNILHEAIEFGLLVPYFQGIRDNATGKIVKFESLVRIIQGGNIISPFEFLQTAKLSGMLPDITKIMIDKSFKVMQSNNFTFSINITEDDLDLGYLLEYLEEKSQEYNIAPSRVILEILEGMSSTGKRDHIRQLNALKRGGYLLAIDDFGAEYSNFERVLELDIDLLKIDARYIKNLDINNKSYEITKSIVYFAKNAGIACVAEFVHNQNIQEIVEKLGIEYSQGYLFSEPKDAPKV